MATKYWVTHIKVTKVEPKEKKRLVFYTKTDDPKNEGKCFLRFSNIDIKQDFLKEALRKRETVTLQVPIPIEPGQMLWLDEEGQILLGDNANNTNRKALFNSKTIF